MSAGTLALEIAGALLVGAGVALQFADLFAARAAAHLRLPAAERFLRSRIVQLAGGFALVAAGISAISAAAGTP